MGDIKFYSPVDFDDTSSGVTIEGDIQLGSFNKISGVASDNLVIAVDTGNTSGGSSIDFQIDGANSAMFINNSRNVGIGTTSPESKLHITDANPILIFEDTTNPNKNRIRNVDGSFIYDADYNSQMGNSRHRFNIDGSEKLRIDASGNVGIGTTSPGEKLEVNGNILVNGSSDSADGLHLKDRTFVAFSDASSVVSRFRSSAAGVFQFQDGSYNTNIVLNTNGNSYFNGGNVGIGTTSPSQKLEVVGNIDLDGDNRHIYFGGNNTFIGENSNSNKLELRGGGNSMGHTVYIDNTGQLGIGTSAPNQKLHVSGSARITGAIYDSNNSPGTSGQILSSTVTGTDWVNQGDVVAGSADKALSVTLTVKNTEAIALTKGQVVCAAPSASPPSGNLIEVKLADNNGTDSMPAIGVLNEGLDAAGGANDEGEAIMFGKVSGIDTSAFDVGDEVFVSDTAGGLTKTKPTGVKYIQKIGVVIRDDANNGTIEVFGAGRTNDVPTPLYIDHANQRLGIGTTSPSTKLDVDGIATSKGFQTNTVNTNYNLISRNSSGNSPLYVQSANNQTNQPIAQFNYGSATANAGTQVLKVGKDTSYFVNTNVGIGTTSPDSILHVESSSPKIQLTNTSTNASSYIDADSGFGSISIMADHGNTSASSQINLMVDGSSKMVVKDTGNVGIGTTSPAEKLTVSGDANVTGKFAVGAAAVHGTYDFYNQLTSYFNGAMTLDSTFTQTGGGNSTFSGNVGIGTASPNYNLEIEGDGYATQGWKVGTAATHVGSLYNNSGLFEMQAATSRQIAFGNATNGEHVRINSLGNVGIGTTSPNAQLQIDTPSANQPGQGLRLNRPSAGTNYHAVEFATNGTVDWSIGQNSNDAFEVYENASAATTRFTIKEGGNVGIGTTSPGEKLVVQDGKVSAGHTNTKGYGFHDLSNYAYTANTGRLSLVSNGIEAVSIDSSQRVGIGTTSPSEKLHINEGTIKVENNAADSVGLILDSPVSGVNVNFSFEVGDTGISGLTPKNLVIRGSSGSSDIAFSPSTSWPGLLMLDGSSGNVGIRNTSPDFTLDVSGDIGLDGKIYHNGDHNTYIGFTADTQTFRTGGSDRVTINNTGVGIGTTSPSTKLEVSAATSAITIRTSYPTDSSQRGALLWKDSANITGAIDTRYDGSTVDMHFGSLYNTGYNSTTRLTIKGNGNVGIGTTNPASRFHIYQPSGATGFRLTRSNNITGVGLNITVDSSKNIISGYGGLTFRTATTGNGTNASEKMRIDTSGNVGIGTTTPQKKLDVYLGTNNAVASIGAGISAGEYAGLHFGYSEAGNANYRHSAIVFERDDTGFGDARGKIHLLNSASGSASADLGDARLTILPAGNVGIGTTSPGELLEVDGNIRLGDGGTRDIIGPTNESLRILANPNSTTEGIIFSTDGGTTTEMFIQDGGNVGIGTTSPSEKLHVFDSGFPQMALQSNGGTWQVGVSSGNDFTFRRGTSGSNYPLWLDSSDNVGIGTTSPSAKLDVAGNTDTTTILGRAKIGSYVSDYMYLSHYDYGTSSNYALKQAPTGSTTVNARYSQTVGLSINNSTKLLVSNTGNVGIGTTSPTERLHVVGDAKIEDDLHVEGDLHLEGDIGFRVINSGGFGQPEIELPNFADVFYRADRRFTVTTTGGTTNVSGLFGGNFSSLTSFAANTTHTITINVSNQSGVPTNGFTYPQGYIYISFYSTTNNYDSISGRFKDKDNNYHSMSGLTDIIPNGGNYKVMRLTVPSNNYAVEYEITLVTGASLVRLAAINYLSSRHTSQMELPYLNKTLDTNRLFGNVDVLTNSSVAQNRLSGTGNSYLNANTGNVGIGTTSPIGRNGYGGQKILEVYNASSYASINVTGNGSTFATIGAQSSGVDLRSSSELRLATNGSNTRMAITSAGNVGIGTTSPAEKLTVSGDANITGKLAVGSASSHPSFAFYNQLNAYFNGAVTVDDTFTQSGGGNSTFSGNVGIGTTSPSQKLDVVGNAQVSGQTHTGTLRVDATAAPPTPAPQQTPLDAIVRPGGNTFIYLSDPDEWLEININGTNYVIPAYEA